MQRTVYLILGPIFLIIGLIGLLLPIVPQVPFLVIALICLTRGSKKVHHLVVSSVFFQKKIRPQLEKSRFLSKLMDLDA